MSDAPRPPESAAPADKQAAIGAAWLADRVVGPRLLLCGEHHPHIVATLAATHDLLVWNASDTQLQELDTALDAGPTSIRQRVQLEQFDPTKPRTLDNQYPTIVVGNLLTHVADLAGLLSNVRNCLIDGGRLLVYTPHGPTPAANAVRRIYGGTLIEVLAGDYALDEIQPVGQGWIGACATPQRHRESAVRRADSCLGTRLSGRPRSHNRTPRTARTGLRRA